jgi:hypothetical protein
MMSAILYVHGMGGSAHEAEHYRRICPGFEVIGVDYEVYVPCEVRDTIRRYYDDARSKYASVSVIANSIGAYFSMLALQGLEVAKAMFVSPVLDMERVILDMMERSGVSEQELREKGEIPTSSGQVLAWEYLCFVRDNPIKWEIPTEILYAEHDDITSRQTVDEFVRTHDAKLTVMKGGEHWFHTEEQIAFLDEWMTMQLRG